MMDFARYKVSEWVMTIKRSLYLIFILQIYVSVESLEEEEHFLGVIYAFQGALEYTLFFFSIFAKNK